MYSNVLQHSGRGRLNDVYVNWVKIKNINKAFLLYIFSKLMNNYAKQSCQRLA